MEGQVLVLGTVRCNTSQGMYAEAFFFSRRAKAGVTGLLFEGLESRDPECVCVCVCMCVK